MGGHSVAVVVLVGLLAVASSGQDVAALPANYQSTLLDTSACPVPNEPVCLNGVPVDVTAVAVDKDVVSISSRYATVTYRADLYGSRVQVVLTKLGLDAVSDEYPFIWVNQIIAIQATGCAIDRTTTEIEAWAKANLAFQRCPGTEGCPVPNEPVCLNGEPVGDTTTVEYDGDWGIKISSRYATVTYYAKLLDDGGRPSKSDAFGNPINTHRVSNELVWTETGYDVASRNDLPVINSVSSCRFENAWAKANLEFQRCPAKKTPPPAATPVPPTPGDSSWGAIWISMATVGGIYIVVGIVWAITITQ